MITASRLACSPVVTLLQPHVGNLLPRGLGIGASAPRLPALPYGVAVALGGGWLVHLLLT